MDFATSALLRTGVSTAATCFARTDTTDAFGPSAAIVGAKGVHLRTLLQAASMRLTVVEGLTSTAALYGCGVDTTLAAALSLRLEDYALAATLCQAVIDLALAASLH
mmetsp:Transcript_73932/g.121991  ORF Transcript_73932/g.121991 Transcript_73932/m.121991 type:complete len:107 (-) Transcript_73932:725-1045(-)